MPVCQDARVAGLSESLQMTLATAPRPSSQRPAAQTAASRHTASLQSDPIRICVVDDAVVVRGMIGRWVGEEDGLELVAAHRNGRLAVERIANDKPDVIVLDIEMPEMDGMTALPLLLKACPNASVIMASTLTSRNAEISLKALSLGAADYVPKPETNSGVSTSADFRRELIEKIRVLGGRSKRRFTPAAAVSPGAVSPAVRKARDAAPLAAALSTQSEPFTLRAEGATPPAVLVIGSSTGGPPALNRVFSDLDKRVFERVPILVTQHMPAAFTSILAEHLGRAAGMPSAEAVDGQPLQRGHIYVAPGGKHMIVTGSRTAPVVRLTDDPPVHFCKPAVDPLFDSVSRIFGGATLAVVLTGMGSDGALGGVKIADGGGTVLAQDQQSSVVWGMPGATAQSGCCSAVLPLDRIADAISRKVIGR
jgi:two-component system chemotaxis response regulator CheB